MSPIAPSDQVQSGQAGAGKKKNNKKKKNNANKQKPAVDIEKEDGVEEKQQPDEQAEAEEISADETEPQSVSAPENEPSNQQDSNANGHATASMTNGHHHPQLDEDEPPASSSASAKLEAMSAEREALRQEVEQLRRQLESIQTSHEQEVSQLRADLEETEAAKDQAETQYQNLLGRVEKIKETLGDRLKRDKAELDEAKDRVEELEAANEELRTGRRAAEEEVERLKSEMAEQGRELAGLRSRSNLSQQNWLKEKEDMSKQTAHLKQELEATAAAMGEWEVIAMEERSMRESLSEKVTDLEEQVGSLRESYERVVAERDTHGLAVDGLQRALQEIQEARKKELREMVESSERQVAELRRLAQEAGEKAAKAEREMEGLRMELERTAPFEKEVKEKNLLIGKLRHEAIVLNDHLTKALKYIKKMKPEEAIDRQIVTNHFLHFLSLDRSDPRKFQILQVIAGLLDWTDEQREKAGLARPGGASNTLRLPMSPFHRTPSSPALNTEFFSEATPTSGKGESLADLWAGFLERSVEEANTAGSRKGSMSSFSMGTGSTARPDTSGG